MSKYGMMARTLPRLGFSNIARVALYRAALKLPSRLKKLSAETPQGPFFFSQKNAAANTTAPSLDKTTLWDKQGTLFSAHSFPISSAPPDWFANPLTRARMKNTDSPWHSIADFDPEVGDIKFIWELSRWSWLPAFAERGKSERGEVERLNNWLEDWVQNNPPYQGPNWKCGQEASLRVLHLIVAGEILAPESKGARTQGFIDLIHLHLKRIAPTVSYATAQDNNHGTSEAAALFIGGSYLATHGEGAQKNDGAKWGALGRKLLENRVAKLVADDGSFAQYSVNYHRLMLDALSLAEWWRAKNSLPVFSKTLVTKMQAASDWLYRLTDDQTGDAPNIGANDGAQILQLTDAPYRDFRPAAALATALWHGTRAYPENQNCTNHLAWLGLNGKLAPLHAVDMNAAGEDGGFAVINQGVTRAVLRFPKFRFRPAQADALHLDLWHKGQNLLRDGGTYSYNTSPQDMAYFGGAATHNTVSFDGHDQMPRLGRFLFGDWLSAELLKSPTQRDSTAAARYRDKFGCTHERHVALNQNVVLVTDELSEFKSEAVLRWRLMPDTYNLDIVDSTHIVLNGPALSLRISSDTPITAQLVQGFESRHYFEKTPLPVLEITTKQAGTLITEIRLNP